MMRKTSLFLASSLGRPLVLLSACRSVRAYNFLGTNRKFLPSGFAVAASTLTFATHGGKNRHSSNTLCASAADNPGSSAQSDSTSSLSIDTTSDDPIASMTGYLNAQDAAALDAELMSTPGFSLEQLMELAGLSVAECVYDVLQGHMSRTAADTSDIPKLSRIIVLCGPGNNGGDGLVAARHLVQFGYHDRVTVVYPKPNTKLPHFASLQKQCQDVGIPIVTDFEFSLLPDENPSSKYDRQTLIVDAMFGFSFHGTPREPFRSIIERLVEIQDDEHITIVAVDIPSGWNVDTGPDGSTFHPDVLVSLTAPKLASKDFSGRHYIGGRFLNPALGEAYGIKMPPYPGVSQVMELPSENREDS